MECRANFSLKSLNTFHVEAVAARYIRFDAESEIVDFLARHPMERQPCLVLGAGSNVLFVENIDGVVLHPLLKGIQVIDTDRRYVRLRAMAGENWDDLVAYTVANGWGGIENLSLIPGSVGASVVQNIGAYGVEVKSVVEWVEAVSIGRREKMVIGPQDCDFGYRYSRFKGPWAGQFIITAVVFRLDRRPEFVLDYPGVLTAVAMVGEVNLDHVRQGIMAIRRRKLPDPDRIGNAGSFFKNPVVSADKLNDLLRTYPELPHYSQDDNRLKLPAGWMIERCGWKGKCVGQAAVHDGQALVLINLGGATGREILELSEMVSAAVCETFGIALEREVLVVPHQGCGC